MQNGSTVGQQILPVISIFNTEMYHTEWMDFTTTQHSTSIEVLDFLIQKLDTSTIKMDGYIMRVMPLDIKNLTVTTLK